MTDIPVWLLDVDGVLNVDESVWGVKLERGYARSDGRRYVIRWVPPLVDRVRDLHTSGVVEARWCTTWCDWADQLEQLWNLPRLGRAFTDVPNDRASMREAKRNAARAVLREGRRLVWTDDIEVPTEGEFHDELYASGRDVLLIKPRGRVGLSPSHMTLIESFSVTPHAAGTIIQGTVQGG